MTKDKIMKMSDELKPCPFCGAIPYKVERQFYIPHENYCYFTYMGDPGYWIEEEAIQAWNRRHHDQDR